MLSFASWFHFLVTARLWLGLSEKVMGRLEDLLWLGLPEREMAMETPEDLLWLGLSEKAMGMGMPQNCSLPEVWVMLREVVLGDSKQRPR